MGRVKISNRSVGGESIYTNYRQELSGLMMPFQVVSNEEENAEDEADSLQT